jgi:hypothetical protein
MPTHARVWATLVAMVMGGIVGGCTNSDDEVASAGTRGEVSASAAVSGQRAGAEAFYACLVDAGLPAELYPTEDSEGDGAQVGWASGHNVLERIPGQTSGVTTEGSENIPQSEIDAFNGEDGQTYRLVIDGVDHTEVFSTCHENSGYVLPAFQTDPVEELRQKQAVTDATNDWIACARENAYPDLVDVSITGSEWPNVQLPASTTVEELRALLEVCPNFDEAEASAVRDSLAAGGIGSLSSADMPAEPNIAIETPPEMTEEDWDSDDPAVAHWEELTAVLMERSTAFWSEVFATAAADPADQ